MRTLTQPIRLTLAASAIVAGSIAVAGPANAVATPAEACGNNYHEIDHQNLQDGVIHLLYDGSTDCVVTEKTTHIGAKTFVSAYIKFADGSNDNNDGGNYDYYAGPVRLNAPRKCIIWGGSAIPSGGIGVGPTAGWESPHPTKDDPRPARAHCG